MTAMRYDIVTNDGEDAGVTVFYKGKSSVATPEHPRFAEIVSSLRDGRAYSDPDAVFGLFDISVPLADKFDRLSDRVLIGGGRIYFDGEEVDDSLTQAIVRFYAEGNKGFQPLVAFLEKVWTNPEKHSREQLYRWLAKHEFSIAEDGDFYAFKGIREDGLSSSSGEAIVNGVFVRGRIPNKPDTIIEMPRSKVNHNPSQGCSTGLHVGSWSYASSFGPVHLLIKINPRDVVSVPTDCSDQKVRVCRYRVVKVNAQLGDVERMLRLGDPEKTAKVVLPPEPEPEPKKPGKRAKKKAARTERHEFPAHYEDFNKRDFDACTTAELRWLAGEWGLRKSLAKSALVKSLMKEARQRRKELDG
jgi:hypothetical protein